MAGIVQLIWNVATLAVAFGPAFAVMEYFDKKERRAAEAAFKLGRPEPKTSAVLQWTVIIAVFIATGLVAKQMFDLTPIIGRALR